MVFSRSLLICVLFFAQQGTTSTVPLHEVDETQGEHASSGFTIFSYEDLEIQVVTIREQKTRSTGTVQLVHPIGYDRIVWKSQIFLAHGVTVERITHDDSGWWFERIGKHNLIFDSWEELTSGPPFDVAGRMKAKLDELGERYRWRTVVRTSDGLRYEASGDRSNKSEAEQVDKEFAAALRSSMPMGMGRALMASDRPEAPGFHGLRSYVVDLIKEESGFSVGPRKAGSAERASVEYREDLEVQASPLIRDFLAGFKTVDDDAPNGLHKLAFRIEDLTLEE